MAERFTTWGNKLPYFFVTINVGSALTGRHEIPIIDSAISGKQHMTSKIKDQNGNGYANNSDPTQEAAPNIVLTFQALKPEYTSILEEFLKYGGLAEVLQENEGRDGKHHDYWVQDPAITGTILYQGKTSFPLTLEGNWVSAPAT